MLDTRDLGERAARAVSERFPGAAVNDLTRLTGGASGITLRGTMTSGSDSRTVVVKVAPAGLVPVRNRDVLAQARVLTVLGSRPGVRVPDVLGTDEGAPVEVPPLFVMSFVEGESFEPQVTPEISDASATDLVARADGALRMAADLHATPLDDPALAGTEPLTLDLEVDRWARAFASVDDQLRGTADSIEVLLRTRLPEAHAPALLHGDWRLGNMLCVGPEIRAVVDWETWSLGDPRLDLAWFLLFAEPGHPHAVRPHTRLPPVGELVATYEHASSAAVSDLPWFAALVRYKQAAACALIVKNNRKRPQPGVDVDALARSVPKLIDSARIQLDN